MQGQTSDALHKDAPTTSVRRRWVGVSASAALPLLRVAGVGGRGGGGSSPVEPGASNRPAAAVGTTAARTLTEGETVPVDPASCSSDPDGDPPTYGATTSGAGVASVSVSGGHPDHRRGRSAESPIHAAKPRVGHGRAGLCGRMGAPVRTRCAGTALAAAALLLPACGSVAAQVVGDRVRVIMATDTFDGRVIGSNEEGFVVALGGSVSRQVSRSQIQRLEIQTGIRDYRWWGLGFGALAGGLAVEQPDAPAGLLAGAAYGFLIGWGIRSTEWETIPDERPGGLTLRPFLDLRRDRDGGSILMLGARGRF